MNAKSLVILKASSDVLGKLAILGVLALAARTLSTDAFAWMAIASTFGWLVSVATDFGLQLHLAGEVARDPAHAGRALWPLLLLRLKTFAAGTVVTVVVVWFWAPHHYFVPVAVVAMSYVFNANVDFFNYAYRGLNRSDLESVINFTQRIVSVIIAWSLLKVWPSFCAVAIAVALPPALAGVVSFFLLRRLAPIDPDAPSALDVRALFRVVAPIGLGILLSALYFRIDLFMLQQWTNEKSVAQYGAVFRLIDAMRLFPGALLAVVLPRMFKGRDTAFLLKLSILLTSFGLVTMIAGEIAAPFGVTLAFGPAYRDAAPLFRILLVAFPLLCLNYGLTTQLVGWKGQRAFAAIAAGVLGANVMFNAMFIPQFGAVGAAWSTVVTEAMLTLCCVVALRHVRARATP